MSPYLIIGGGISGLSAACLLKEARVPFTGLEASDQLGGRLPIGHHRVYEDSSVDFFKNQLPQIEWIQINDAPRLRRKGEWAAVGQEMSPQESFYLQSPYFKPEGCFESFVSQFKEKVGNHFLLNKAVQRIEPEKKFVICQDDSEYSFSKIIWCASIELLGKVWKGDISSLAKVAKKTEAPLGGINLDFDLKEPLFDFHNTVVFPFRFKDQTLKALGTQDHTSPHFKKGCSLHWMIFLSKSLFEDREEVAKLVRTLKRELKKEFIDLEKNILGEKISYLPGLSGETPVPITQLEILPDIFYLGPQLSLEGSSTHLRNIDQNVANYRKFQTLLEN